MNREASDDHALRCTLATALEGLSELQRKLRGLRGGEVSTVIDAGLCDAMRGPGTFRSQGLLKQYLEVTHWLDWDYHSGVAAFPVPAPPAIEANWRGLEEVDGYQSAAAMAYFQAPRWKGTYGRMRRLLLNHLVRELPDQILEQDVECCHADTCLPDFWGGHHLPHVQIPVWRGMTIGDVRRSILSELRQGYVMGSTEEARLLAADMVRPEEDALATFLFEKVCKSVEALRAAPGKRRLFTDLEPQEDDDESVYAYFVFTGLECPSYDLP